MAASPKDTARRIIEHLLDDVSFVSLLDALQRAAELHDSAKQNEDVRAFASKIKREISGEAASQEAVTYHLEHRGWVTVLVPDRPAPPITVEMVNDLIDR
jgi:hypothetical protein